MTNYDRLIDAIKDYLYTEYLSGKCGDNWDETAAATTAHEILKIVEEFQQKRAAMWQLKNLHTDPPTVHRIMYS